MFSRYQPQLVSRISGINSMKGPRLLSSVFLKVKAPEAAETSQTAPATTVEATTVEATTVEATTVDGFLSVVVWIQG